MLILLVTFSTALSIGLALTNSFVAFEVLSFFVAMATIVPQVLLTLTADLAKPERRARGLSIVLSGLVFGIVVRAGSLAGVAHLISWHVFSRV